MVEDLVDVTPEPFWIDGGKARPAREQGCCTQWPPGEGPELGHGLTVASDGQPLASRHPVHHGAAAVSQISDRHSRHDPNVSRVRHEIRG